LCANRIFDFGLSILILAGAVLAGKREKKAKQAVADEGRLGAAGHPSREAHAPKKRPVMLAVSLVLFVLWFIFLLVTAVFG